MGRPAFFCLQTGTAEIAAAAMVTRCRPAMQHPRAGDEGRPLRLTWIKILPYSVDRIVDGEYRHVWRRSCIVA
jgi:hypothetical protein